MKNILLLFLCALTINLNAQVNLLSLSTADGAVNVPLSTTISVIFDTPIDTLKGFDFFENFFTNATDITAQWYSADLKTVNLGVNLEVDKNYYFLVNSAFGSGGEMLLNPSVFYFTTGSTLAGSLVSGTVSVEQNSGINIKNTVVVLSSTPVDQGEPILETGALTNSQGAFSIPFVKDGVYYPIAVNDANGDGRLDPGNGDAFVFLDPITLSGNFSGLNMPLQIPEPLSLFEATGQAQNLILERFSGNAYLKSINARGVGPDGKTNRWEFSYISDTLNQIIYLEIDLFGHYFDTSIDEWSYQNYSNMETIPQIVDLSAMTSFIQNAENAGGNNFRTQTQPSNFELEVELYLADHRYSHWAYQNPDPSRHLMWAIGYKWYQEISEDNWQQESELYYWGDFQTGTLIVTDISPNELEKVNIHSLSQNYPNPFNPTTVISYSIPQIEYVNITIFDLLGNKVATLVNEQKYSGNYEVNFDAAIYPSGTYFYQIKTESYTNTKKMILLK